MSANNSKYILDTPCYYKDLVYGKIRYYLQTYYNTNFDVSKITHNIYISDLPSACNKDKLKELGITHILSTVLGFDAMFPDDFQYKNVYVRDVVHQDLTPYFDECVKFIKDVVDNRGKVLVHCSYGVSRSASMVIAYLIKECGMTYNSAYKYVKQRREIIEPNEGFKEQLINYE